MLDLTGKNVKVFSGAAEFEQKLLDFGAITKGHFEYKKVANDGTHMRGEYFVDFRKLDTPQEIEMVPMYELAIKEFFGNDLKDIIIVGVAYATIAFAKSIQVQLFEKLGIEYAYTEKRDGKLGIFDAQARKVKGKHILFLEDVCNNCASLTDLNAFMAANQEKLEVKKYSVLYGTHRGHSFSEVPKNEIYAMSVIYAPAYHVSELPEEIKQRPLKEYKK
jgi:orotate phosphoribosyltransferase